EKHGTRRRKMRKLKKNEEWGIFHEDLCCEDCGLIPQSWHTKDMLLRGMCPDCGGKNIKRRKVRNIIRERWWGIDVVDVVKWEEV
ncbi:MAG: hypothetical protein ACR2PH_07535, partial [Desulfobulbia bacterium]